MQPEPIDTAPQPYGNQYPSSATACTHCCRTFLKPDTLALLTSQDGLDYRRNRQDMMRTALDGCPLCRELLCMPYNHKRYVPQNKTTWYTRRELGRDWFWPIRDWTSATKLRLERARRQPVGFVEEELRFTWKCEGSKLHHLIVLRHQRNPRAKNLHLKVLLSAEYDNPACAHIPNRTVERNVRCPRTYRKLRTWISKCEQEHPKCNEGFPMIPISISSPALVLDVSFHTDSKSDTIRLHRVQGQTIRYAALSYTWGGSQLHATTSSNISKYLHGIEVSSLPQTIQDAVYVARQLHIQHLWVDSMCIIQDSKEHKIVEIGKMKDIYYKAYLTISASSAHNCDEGFLHVREPIPNTFVLPFCGTDNAIGSISLCVLDDPSDERYRFPKEPINERAWTFQEAFLSHRILFYSRFQVFWGCAEYWGQDGGDTKRDCYFAMACNRYSMDSLEDVLARFGFETLENQITSKSVPSLQECSVRTAKDPSLDDWMSVVQEYSSKQLTYPADKLPALSGIASFFSDTWNADYLAGLWPQNFREQLCWSTQVGIFRYSIRPPSWRAPSWSFLSVDGDFEFVTKRKAKGRHPDFDYDEKAQYLGCKVLLCHVTPLSRETPFGEIGCAYLKLQGRLIQVRRKEVTNVVYLDATNQDLGLFHPDAYMDGNISTDIVETTVGFFQRSEPLWFLMIFAAYGHFNDHLDGLRINPDLSQRHSPWGLALARLPNGNYHRIGFIEGYRATINFFCEQEVKTITIV